MGMPRHDLLGTRHKREKSNEDKGSSECSDESHNANKGKTPQILQDFSSNAVRTTDFLKAQAELRAVLPLQ